MKTNAFREYRFRFYLNARHYVVFEGKRGQIHPHTWEFAMTVLIRRNQMIIFDQIEKAVNDFMETYQNTLLNEKEPFTHVNPTLENITDYIAEELYDKAASFDTVLVRVEGSETPSRTYICDLSDRISYENDRQRKISTSMEEVLDEMIRNGLEDDGKEE